MRTYQVAILVAVVLAIVLIIALQAGANLYTNYLWFRSIGFTMVWRSMEATKLELGAVFSGVMFAFTWVSLWVVDRIAPRALFMAPETEVVSRYQASLGRHRFAVRSVAAVIVGLAVGSGATAQWQHWLLYMNGGSFGLKDPQFHRDVGYFVFKLPFLSFLVDWAELAIVVLFVLSVVAHYLNGGLRFSGPSPRVDPRTVAHLSTIVAAFALLRAVAYFTIDRYALDLATNGYVAGAGYTDVHVRIPALELLAFISLVAFGMLAFNVYQRSLALPVVAVGLWALVAIAIGVVFPAVVQWLQVNPAQSTVELPYISRNIAATRAAMGLDSVTSTPFAAQADLTGADLAAPNNQPTISSVGLWDPGIASQTFQKLQSVRGYYNIASLSSDRYLLGTGSKRRLTPVVIGAREIVPNDVGTPSWVNVHLEYTHGYGYVMAPANSWGSDGQPNFDSSNLPPTSSSGAPGLSGRYQDIYFGTGMSSYSIVNTRQSEVDYINKANQLVTSHYSGNGGVALGGFWTRAAFAFRFHDFNLLVSHLITPKSRIIYTEDIRARIEKVAPFLQVDSHPYPVVANGQLWWIVDGYTASSYFPYGQPANTSNLPNGSALNGSYNYVRDSVKAVVNAYTGSVSLYAADPSDPILQAWEAAFPGMFKPLSAMPAELQQHLRYPEDLLMLQATMYGLYHLTPSEASSFYSKSDVWQIAPQSTSNPTALQPVYELLRLPRQSSLSFDAVEPMVPYSPSGRPQTLSAFLVASSSASSPTSVTAYQIPPGASDAPAPSIVKGDIESNLVVSQLITKLDQHGSQVTLGPMVLLPIDDSLLFVETMYLHSTANPAPLVKEVIVYYNNDVYMATDLGGALVQVFGQTAGPPGSSGTGTVSQAVRNLLAAANTDYQAAQAALASGNYTAWGKDLAQVGQDLKLAEQALSHGKGSSGSGSSGSGSGSSSSSGSGSGAPSSSHATTRTAKATNGSTSTPSPSSPATSSSGGASVTPNTLGDGA